MEIKGIEEEYICAASNCTYNSFEFLTDSSILYAASHALVLYDLEGQKSIKTLISHSGRVNCVRLVKRTDSNAPSSIISCSSTGEVAIWQKHPDDFSSLVLSFCRKLSDASLPVCDAIQTNDQKILFGIITALSEIVFFQYFHEANEDERLTKLQTVSLKLSAALDLCFYNLSQDNDENIVAAVGMDSGSVVLYGMKITEDVIKFEPEITLKKHEDWVRCVVFSKYRDQIYLASGGQDSFIALWRFTTAEVEVSEFEFQVHKFGKYNIVFDSLIMGHEGWINSLHWNAANTKGEGSLISCSSDQSVIMWDKGDSIWEEKKRFGTIGGQVPGGFGAQANSKFLAVCGFQGAIQIWKADEDSTEYILQPSITGHFGAVTDLDYDHTGSFLVTTSLDQTTRAHSRWGQKRWHEVSRPQIHGHDIFTMKMIGDYIVSGSEEKILRVFQPTDVFQKNLQDAAKIDVTFLEHITSAATLPALGLSNLSEVPNELQESSMPHFTELKLEERLDEDFLRSQTLWPEVSKLYGHVYEIACVATSSVHPLIASGSQSSKPQFSSIILWSTTDFVSLGEYAFHKLNVTDMEFSKCGNYLLSGSRDRTWAVWNIVHTSKFTLELQESGSFHTRALWVTTWAVDTSFFVTGARDKKLICWMKPREKYEVTAVETFAASVSAASVNYDNMIAVGLETGDIFLLHFNPSGAGSNPLLILKHLSFSLAHHAAVKRLRFNPRNKKELASAASDNFVRVYQIWY